MLTCFVAQFGPLGWDAIAACMPGRNARQCRERWKHYLSVGFSDRPWTKEEDELLMLKQEEFGPRWTKISAFFQKRSDIQLKARWTRLMEKKAKAAKTQADVEPVAPAEQPGVVFHVDDEPTFTEFENGFDDGSSWTSAWKFETPYL
jgi:hypothetical protein